MECSSRCTTDDETLALLLEVGARVVVDKPWRDSGVQFAKYRLHNCGRLHNTQWVAVLIMVGARR